MRIATTGGFLSEDPISFAAGDYNLSRYVFGSPINGTDPSGLLFYPDGKYAGGPLQKIATKLAPLVKALKFGGKLLGPFGKIYDNLIDTEPLTNSEEAFLNPNRMTGYPRLPSPILPITRSQKDLRVLYDIRIPGY